VPLLGICFGAQVLAAALGGSVTRLPAPEHAWIEVESEHIPSGPWLALHEDGITLPPAARETARNERGTQAFSIARHMGVQFHPEVTPSILSGWIADKAGLVSTELLVGVAERSQRAAAGALTLFDAFLAGAQAPAALAYPGGAR
jgi:GMP synthase-like glutamine amidotransferase